MRRPSTAEWRSLYEAAADFQRLACWTWMWDNELFGVKNPETGEIGYCSVTGRLGTHFALVVYPGAHGLAVYQRVLSGELTADSPDAVPVHDCIKVSFEPRDDLERLDLGVIESLGLTFPDAGAWPLFRSHRPGYIPWFLDADEARFLTHALRQAVVVGNRVRHHPGALNAPAPGKVFVRVPHETKTGLAWRDAWRVPEVVGPDPLIPCSPPCTVLIEKVARRTLPQRGAWEVDLFYAFRPVRDRAGERPYFPRQLLVMDHDSRMAVTTALARPDDYVEYFRSKFLCVLQESGAKPEVVMARGKESSALLLPILSALGIRLQLTQQLPCVDHFRRELRGAVRRHGGELRP